MADEIQTPQEPSRAPTRSVGVQALVSVPGYAAAYKSELERVSGRAVSMRRNGSWWYVDVENWGDWDIQKSKMLSDTENLREWDDGELWSQFR